MAQKICAVDGCEKKLHAHGYCARHAYHFRLHGDPLGGRRGAGPGEPLRWIEEHASFEGDECLGWPFERSAYGYGVVKVVGRRRVASRVMCERVHGAPPDPRLDAAHSCGRGDQGCMTPRHLHWATRGQNNDEAVAAGTWMKGENARAAKLTREQIAEIRQIGRSMKQADIAARYGVGQGAISRVLSGKRWGWLSDVGSDGQLRQ